MSKLEPIVNQEPKELDVPCFSKKDVQKIIAEYLNDRSVEEVLKDYVEVPSSMVTTPEVDEPEPAELTTEIAEFIKKAFKTGKVCFRGSEYYSLNYAHLNPYVKETDGISGLCFGCISSNREIGGHIEILIYDDDSKWFYTFFYGEV